MSKSTERKIPFLHGKIETREDAEKVIRKAANIFLIICGLIALTFALNIIQQGSTYSQIGEFIGTVIGNLIVLSIIAIPALLLKKRHSSIAAKFLFGIFAICLIFGLYLTLVPGVLVGNYKMALTGAIIVLWWACCLRLAMRADYAAKIFKSTPAIT